MQLSDKLIFLIIIFTFYHLSFAIQPDEVLVLYNADWREDLPGSNPGQDSLEVAQYYVSRHTDPKTGKKPYLLGLHCVHWRQKHLNSSILEEKSNDNRGGVIHKQIKLKDNWFLPELRHVMFEIKDPKNEVDLDTLKIEIIPLERKSEKITVVEHGFPTGVTRIYFEEIPNNTYRIGFDASLFSLETAIVKFQVKRKDGKIFKKIEQNYYNLRDFIASKTGPDGIRDDKNYLEDIEKQVKAFLENPKNALPDGTLLKDHILCIVVCYGLPRIVKSTYGIARGITTNLANHGVWSSLEQRLALMYYNVDKIMEFEKVGIFRTDLRKGIMPYLIRTGMVRPMYGPMVNPYLHPMAFKKKPQKINWPKMPYFNQTWRAKNSDKFLYIVTRIDGITPQQAKNQIDNAIYANYFLTPAIGNTQKQIKKTSIPNDLYGVKGLKDLGFKHVYQGNKKFRNTGYGKVIIFNLLDPTPPFFNLEPVYLPGGIAHRVESHNGWKKATAFYRMLNRGVTFTGGVARVYHGAPHTTSASWWDDDVLFHYLLHGYTLGEAYLMSSPFLNWITSVVGDPLYCPNLEKTNIDTFPPQIAAPPEIKIYKLSKHKRKALFSLHLKQNPYPKVAQLKLIYWCENESPKTAISSVFSANPQLWLTDLEQNTTYLYKFQLIDPYTNLFKSQTYQFTTK